MSTTSTSHQASGLDFFNDTSNKARRPRTAYKYSLWERRFKEWLTRKHPGVLEDEVPQCVRITDDILKEFFGDISYYQEGERGTKAKPDLIGKVKSNKVAEGARSALVKGIYKEQGVEFPVHLFEDFKVGYRKMVRQEMQTGEREDNSMVSVKIIRWTVLHMISMCLWQR
jgi:hypothetical protein